MDDYMGVHFEDYSVDEFGVALKNEAKKLGYEADKKKEFFFKEDAPYILFLELGKPFPYLMQISK